MLVTSAGKIDELSYKEGKLRQTKDSPGSIRR